MIVENKIHWDVIFKYSLNNILFSLSVTLIAVVLHFTMGVDSWQIPMAIIATLGTALAIMLGFRNGSAYERWWEARKIWGGLVNDSRSYTRQALSLINPPDTSDDHDSEAREIQRDIITSHISFIHALRLQLRDVSGSEQWNEKVYRGLKDETRAVISRKSNKATQLLIQQGLKLDACKKAGLLSEYGRIQMDTTLSKFSDHQGKAERIKKTPFPKAYEIFNRILLNLFILFLPFSLLPIFHDMNGWWLVFPVTVLIAWVFYGIHRMGIHMAKPFENFRWDVPIDAICNTIEIDMLEAVDNPDIPQKLEPVDGILM